MEFILMNFYTADFFTTYLILARHDQISELK